MKTQLLIALSFVIAISGGWAIAQVDPLTESVTTITDLEAAKDTQLLQLEFENLTFTDEIQTLNDAIAISQVEKTVVKTQLITNLIQTQLLLDQVLVQLTTIP